MVLSERCSLDLSEYTLFQIVAKLFRLLARFAPGRILNSRPGGSREVLGSFSESGFIFYSIILTVAFFLCSNVGSINFYLRRTIRCQKKTLVSRPENHRALS